MRLLYVHYGPQSGVTESVTRALLEAGVDLRHFNPLDGFTYQLRLGPLLVPNARPAVVRAVAAAMRRHGAHWKPYYLHTTRAFDALSERCAEAIAATRPELVLQAGALFGAGPYPQVPYFLYLDHTRAIAERYAPMEGLPPPIPYEEAWRARERATYRNAAGIFTMSEYVRASLRADYGVDGARVHVIGAGPNVEPGPSDLGVHREKAFLFVGRNFVPKGGPELLAAFAAVRAVHPDARLWIVSKHRPATAPPGVTFHGLLEPPALARLYARASAFVLPTLREAFGLSFLEAMAFALPCIGTRIEAIPEIVSENETGLLVPPRDPAALANAMRELLADPVRARLMGAAGRARVAQRYGWDRGAARILAVLLPGRAARTQRAG
ncbi:MAG TPA: glycosyltransferase family 4 protein [Anaeromyxobacteraceae bacterium]|nr:glycosyltransferase family 4 protein [Anaeromyxobacteraceae bacterium]